MRKSLRLQILVPFLALIVLASGMATYLGYRSTLGLEVKSSSKDAETLMEVVNQNVDQYLKEHERLANRLAADVDLQKYLTVGPQTKEGKTLQPVLQDMFQDSLKADQQLVNVYVASPSKDMMVMPSTDLPAGFDPTSRDWYKKAVEHPNAAVWLEPYQDTATKKIVLTVAQAVYYQGKTIGVVGVDLKIDSLVSIMNDITIGETGYLFMMDGQSKVLSHKKMELIGSDQSGEDFVKKMKELGDKGVVSYTFEGHSKLMAFVTNETTGWKLCGTVFTKEFEEKSYGIVKPMLISLLVIILVAAAVSWPVTQSIIRPVRSLESAMKEFQDGKLTARSGVKRSNEIGKLAAGFDEMAAQVGRLIGQIRETSVQLGESSRILMSGSSETAASSEEVAHAVQEIAAGAGSQAGIVERNAEIVSLMAGQIETVAGETEEMGRLTAHMMDIAKVNVERLELLSEQTNRSVGLSRTVSETMGSLDECSEQIGGIVALMADITSQTNLLALNAAIEAARAGEHGRGFGVVAGEVRKLAGHSEEALKQVQQLVDRIRSETRHASALTEEAGLAMAEQEKAVRQTNEAFGSIHDSVRAHMEGISRVIDAVRDLTEGKEVISSNTVQLQAISQTTVAGTEEVSASIEEQSAAMEQLSKLARDLEGAAQRLADEIKRFEV